MGSSKVGGSRIRKLCECGRPTAIKGQVDGEPRYRSKCERCRNRKFAGSAYCEIYNWKGVLDRHRIRPGEDGGKYILGNIMKICPNCHRHMHGHGQQNQRQKYSDADFTEEEYEEMDNAHMYGA